MATNSSDASLMATLVAQMAANADRLAEAQTETLKGFGSSLLDYARMSNDRGFKGEKPKITAENPISLSNELQAYKRYMNENKVWKLHPF